MTVEALMHWLAKFDGGTPVLLEDNEFGNYYALEDVRLSAVRHTDVGLGPTDQQWVASPDSDRDAPRAVLLGRNEPHAWES